MKLRLPILIACLGLQTLVFAQHPVAFFTKAEAAKVKSDLNRYPLLQSSYRDMKTEVDAWIGKDVDVPFPKDPAGGYTHDRHKANYILMFNSGVLYHLTGDARYALLVKNMLLKYAALNTTLGRHPQATSSSPGRIFWQALNDANWLVYAGLAYDLVHNSLSAAERRQIEEGAFKPEVDYLTKDLSSWFNLIHNHGVWACAGVGIVGIASDNREYVDMALYGTDKKGKSGFLAQLDQLFSPDGYYTEGPYYVRYALLPYYIFAGALHNARPDLKIFAYRDEILRKALHAGLQQTNINGTFLPLNDAIKQKDVTTNELVTAVSIAWKAYGSDPSLLPVARKQNRVLLNGGGSAIAAILAGNTKIPPYYPYKSVEYVDGARGDEGGVSYIRMGTNEALTTMAFKYAAHGLSHGHYDRLGFFLFDKGNEVFQDYGSVRYVNVEQKYGGRYLPENKSFAAQTIAHSTIVADETSHFNGREEAAEKHHGTKVFSSIGNAGVQVASAREDNAYKDVKLHRTLYALQLPGTQRRFVVDVFHAQSDKTHQYDLPFQYSGQVMHTSFQYKAHTSTREALGKKNGYQFYWKEAEALAGGPLTQFTFLNDKTYYTVSSLTDDSTRLYFVRSGANDPNFNLRQEPAFILRKRGSNTAFVNVMEIHGGYNAVTEFSYEATPAVKEISLLYNNEDYTVTRVMIGEKQLLLAHSNKEGGKMQKHRLTISGRVLEWTGPFTVIFDGKTISS